MGAHAASLYVEIEIGAPVGEVWERTQRPELHERWDARFSEIRYLPRPDPAGPQRFVYATRIGFGLRVRGEGESVGESGGDGGTRTSALKFWSDDRKSLIRAGSGYWQYVPTSPGAGPRESTRFLTRYDYDVRFGAAGRVIDRFAFRPLLGWATAWSFDRLRLWIERGIDPASSLRLWLVHACCRVSLGAVFVYHGLVPKLIERHADELAMLEAGGVSSAAAPGVLAGVGVVEVLLGVLVLLAWGWRWPLWIVLAAMPLALAGVAATSPQRLAAPFNPVTLNLLVACVAAAALVSGRDVPSAGRCLRRPAREGDR